MLAEQEKLSTFISLSQDSKRSQIESLLDSYQTIEAFFDDISIVLAEKAEHIRTNWQDETTASYYDAMSDNIAAIS